MKAQIDVADKGRPAKVWQVYEKEIIIEHLTKNRERFGLSLSDLSEKRASISGADKDGLQSLVNETYSDPKLRRSLLSAVGKKTKDDSLPKYEMIGVSPAVKRRFMSAKANLGYTEKDVSSFLSDLLTCFEDFKGKGSSS